MYNYLCIGENVIIIIFHFSVIADFRSTDDCTDGNITLYNGPYPNEGLLLICANRAWTSVCYNSYWSEQDTRVVCTQLGYTIYGKLYYVLCVGSIIIMQYMSYTATCDIVDASC